jgi:hypothetical protein
MQVAIQKTIRQECTFFPPMLPPPLRYLVQVLARTQLFLFNRPNIHMGNEDMKRLNMKELYAYRLKGILEFFILIKFSCNVSYEIENGEMNLPSFCRMVDVCSCLDTYTCFSFTLLHQHISLVLGFSKQPTCCHTFHLQLLLHFLNYLHDQYMKLCV